MSPMTGIPVLHQLVIPEDGTLAVIGVEDNHLKYKAITSATCITADVNSYIAGF